ncbi:unnamed protein product [Peronospora destructor]|uniref:V-type proton ATPase subunit C n=1 Tax=Peronospora destructor TaxID=86335 RepID=A0AAV0TE62_9STRA|nr:unnamed protein product [Peronospora destructor]
MRAKERHFVVREFNFDPTSHASNEEAIAELEVKVHYGETFIAWMHIKIIRVFVESVLRYRLPVNFVVITFKLRCSIIFFGPHAGKDRKLRSVLSKKYAHLQPAQFSGLEKGASGSSQVEYFLYVMRSFHPLNM